jgi:hypothetical protein
MNPPIYGADTPMTLFRPDCKGWGLTEFQDLLKAKMQRTIPGVTTPMAYFGMWKARSCRFSSKPQATERTVGRGGVEVGLATRTVSGGPLQPHAVPCTL